MTLVSTVRAPQGDTRLPLRRPARGRWVGGVCLGLSAHLGVPVRQVRLIMLLLAVLGGAGVLAYVFLWVTVSAGEQPTESVTVRLIE